jgi:hypothetical protein
VVKRGNLYHTGILNTIANIREAPGRVLPDFTVPAHSIYYERVGYHPPHTTVPGPQ